MSENYNQHAAAEIAIGIGHLKAALNLWAPGVKLSPREEKESAEVAAWNRFYALVTKLEKLQRDEGP